MADLPRAKDVDDLVGVCREGGVVICWRNQTRFNLNDTLRQRIGLTGSPRAGEPLIVTMNAYGFSGTSGAGLFNGEQVIVQSWEDAPDGAVFDAFDPILKRGPVRVRFGDAVVGDGERASICFEELTGAVDQHMRDRSAVIRAVTRAAWARGKQTTTRTVIQPQYVAAAEAIGVVLIPALKLEDIGVAFKRAAFHAHPDRGGTHEGMLRVVEARDTLLVALASGWLWREVNEALARAPLLHANFGYVLTAHKAQGSEWPRVVDFAERGVLEDARWVYTALTRARDHAEVYWP